MADDNNNNNNPPPLFNLGEMNKKENRPGEGMFKKGKKTRNNGATWLPASQRKMWDYYNTHQTVADIRMLKDRITELEERVSAVNKVIDGLQEEFKKVWTFMHMMGVDLFNWMNDWRTPDVETGPITDLACKEEGKSLEDTWFDNHEKEMLSMIEGENVFDLKSVHIE